MIKNYLTYIKESIHDVLDPYGEEEWNEYFKFENGDTVELIDPINSLWIGKSLDFCDSDVAKNSIGKVVLTTTSNGLSLVFVDFPTSSRWYNSRNLKLISTNESIKESIHDEIDPYGEEDWDEPIAKGDKVRCINDCDIITTDRHHPIKVGDIKIVKGVTELIWFDDTPNGHGSYDKKNFVKI